ncbi:MAG TPA: leucyl aminopeptidase family protein [Hyphomicrobiales bacterium]|nr:leucyl aminopeptidase family protein [Rhodobiaceae bacterium]HXK53517.1 leucyl aminopeptidase family protein [Hyphomicrobiales bacterium]
MPLHSALTTAGRARAVPIISVCPNRMKGVLEGFPRFIAKWAHVSGFSAASGEIGLVPNAKGNLEAVLLGLGGPNPDPLLCGCLPARLPAGRYRLDPAPQNGEMAALGWVLGTYAFSRYRQKDTRQAQLVLPAGADGAHVTRMATSVFLARDLINTPANDMGPAALEAAARDLAKAYGARISVIRGDALLAKGFPLVHAVGRASAQAPRLIDMRWGPVRAPKVTLVGKGVCFDSGGLDLKTSAGMLLMKKDMGGAANAMALARMIMDAELPLRLRLIVPAVENAVSGGAFRPGDVYASRKGLSVEIGNTDAEGRLILADALALADEEKPDLLIDLATLTGAARVALGPDLPAFFTDDSALAAELNHKAAHAADPMWRLPLWRPYGARLDSSIADINNVSNDGFAGAITAALFLDRFVEQAGSWVHFDIFGWNPECRPARPKGGEAQAIRALYALICDRYYA